MFNFDANNYLSKIATSPSDHYKELNQATLDLMWEDTTQIFNIKEQTALPFTDEYTEYEAWINTVSDTMVNTSKNYSDFVRVLFKDVDHSQNYKGQYYKMALDSEEEEYYICYDRMNKLTQTADFKCVRCNNVLTWKDSNGNIITAPCYLGSDISSTNNLVSKDGTVPNSRMVIFIQGNKYTKSIVKNQRFLFEHSTAFKVEEVNNYMQEQGTNGEITLVKIYVDYSAILPTDNLDLNICDYYTYNYNLSINQSDISQINGFNGTLSATIKNNEYIVEVPIVWSSSDEEVVTIDNDGNYKIVGTDGQSATIKCCMENNESVYDEITISVVNSYLGDKKLIISPNSLNEIKQGRSVNFVCKVEVEGETQVQPITYTTNWSDDNNYIIEESVDGYKLTNKYRSTKPLIITFKSEDCEDVVYTINLIGII